MMPMQCLPLPEWMISEIICHCGKHYRTTTGFYRHQQQQSFSPYHQFQRIIEGAYPRSGAYR